MPKYRVSDYDCLNVKLKTYYARKRKLYEEQYPDFYDVDLRQLFAAPAGIKASVSATTAATSNKCRFPMDQREEIPGEPTAREAYSPLRAARVACAERRSAAGFSRDRLSSPPW